MIIETYIDAKELTNNQSLVIIDDSGKRWDVEEALRNSMDTSSREGSRKFNNRVVLERWHVELGDPMQESPADLGTILPRIYKNSIVLFRSLYTYAKLLPTWKLGKKVSKARSAQDLPKLKFRILDGTQPVPSPSVDALSLSLFDSIGKVVDTYTFGSIDSPAGPFSIKVAYRTHCDFRIVNSEALLSSHFMGMDEEMFEPSLGHRSPMSTNEQLARRTISRTEVGSLPPTRRDSQRADQGQAYGSLSTFHHSGARMSSSPLSALRAARDMSQESPSNSPPLKVPPDHRSAHGSRSSLRSIEGAAPMGRRTSVSFMPFKSPSLSASPLQNERPVTSSPHGSVGRTSTLSALAEARNPSSTGLHTGQPSRVSPILPDVSVSPSTSYSPRPAPMARYSSSFGHRRAKLSVGGGSKTEDDNNSSGKASITSSAQPGSGVLAEGNASSGSIHTDDDNISDFLKMLDQKKDLKSFQGSANGAMADASTRRTTAALSKFQRMRDSNAALSESMSSSLLLHRSSISSSRQLSSVPPMVTGTSTSVASSPGKPVSPHTPHTPAIPSRLSANSIIDYNQRARSSGRHRLSHGDDIPAEEHAGDNGDLAEGTGAIDIPTSPRPFHPSYRRSSSVAQQHRPHTMDDDSGEILPFGMRSASLGDGEERPHVSLSALLALQEGSDVAVPAAHRHERAFGPEPGRADGGVPMDRQQSCSHEGPADDRPPSARGIPYRLRVGRGSGSSDQRGGRYSFPRPLSHFEDEEPLLFAMSDFGTGPHSRRSLEEGRGGSSGGSGGSGCGHHDRAGTTGSDSRSSGQRTSQR